MYKNNWQCVIKFLISHLIITITANTPQTQTAVFKGVPDNWAGSIDIDPFVKIGQKYYFVDVKSDVNWYDAAHECSKRNAQLVSIENAGEADALSSYLQGRGLNEWFWTSGNDLGTEGKYYWLGTGNPIGFARWAKTQPDNAAGNENCIHLVLLDDQYVMNDRACTAKAQFICEAKMPTTVAITVW